MLGSLETRQRSALRRGRAWHGPATTHATPRPATSGSRRRSGPPPTPYATTWTPPSTAHGWGVWTVRPDASRAPGAARSAWGDTLRAGGVERLSRQLRVTLAWLLRPLRQPAPIRAFVGAVLLRVTALAAAGGLLWFLMPGVLAVIRLAVDLLALVAMLLLFGLALGSTGANRRRRR